MLRGRAVRAGCWWRRTIVFERVVAGSAILLPLCWRPEWKQNLLAPGLGAPSSLQPCGWDGGCGHHNGPSNRSTMKNKDRTNVMWNNVVKIQTLTWKKKRTKVTRRNELKCYEKRHELKVKRIPLRSAAKYRINPSISNRVTLPAVTLSSLWCRLVALQPNRTWLK